MTVKPALCSAALYLSGSVTALKSGVVAHGIVEIAGPGAHHVIDTESRVRPQHARDLGGQSLLVFDVHADIQHIGAIEASFGEWHRKRAALTKRYALIELDPVA
jgi:hypothetical protein